MLLKYATYRFFKMIKHLSALTKDFWNYMSLFATVNVLMYILKIKIISETRIRAGTGIYKTVITGAKGN